MFLTLTVYKHFETSKKEGLLLQKREHQMDFTN